MRWFSSMPSEVRRQIHVIMQQDGTTDTAEPLRRAIAAGIASGEFPNADAAQDALSIRALCAAAASDEAGWFGDNRGEVVAHVASFVMAALTNPRSRALLSSTPRDWSHI